jgi:outer membrane biosynthesis protein TonB
MREPERPGGRQMMALGLVATLGIHGALILSVVIGGWHKGAQAAQPVLGQVVDVQAVKFGKPRDLSFLPHKAPPKVAKPKPKIALTQNEQALPRLKPPEAEEKRDPNEDPLERLKALGRKFDTGEEGSTGSNEEEGDPNGLKGGTATVGRGPVYYQHLQAAVQNAWVVPTTISDNDLGRLKAQACIKINEAGKIVESHLSQASGNERFDATLLEAINRIQDFEPPTPDVREVVTSQGVCMNFSKSR